MSIGISTCGASPCAEAVDDKKDKVQIVFYKFLLDSVKHRVYPARMAIKITGKYTGNKNVAVTHEPSAAAFHTAAPLDNQGDGSSFSPTDLVATGLGACMLTIIGIVAEREEFDISDASFSVTKHMQDNPRRIAKLEVEIVLPENTPETLRRKFESAAKQCPVDKSLHPDIEVPVIFSYEG